MRLISIPAAGRNAAVLAASAVAVMLLPAPAGAVLSGPNGRIVFTSGRSAADGNDSVAKLYMRTILSGTGAGAVSPTITPLDGVQHRHPTWSPDRTRVAYAAGNPATQDFDIYTINLTVPGATPVNISNSPGVTDDNPAWSPDGTRIAYQSEVTDASNKTDILVDFPAGGVPTLNLTQNASGAASTTPAWTPGSGRLVFAYGAGVNLAFPDLYSVPATGGQSRIELDVNSMSANQPSVSPDGTKLCYTRGAGAAAEVFVSVFNGQDEGTSLSDAPGVADYNCVWSPDGTKIAYASGATTTAALVMENSDDSGGFVVLEDDPGNFDGNPDWAPDGSPTCQPGTATATAGTPVQIPLNCADSGPLYEQTDVRETTGCNSCTAPANGTLGDVQQGSPSTVTYTPRAGFTGTDTFRFSGSDARSFATPVTMTVTVNPAPAGGGGGQGGGTPGTTGAPPFPAKLEIARARIASGRLDVLAPITARASGRVKVSFQAAGRTERFTAAVDAGNSRVRINRRLPAAQARLGTGILTIAYPGDADTQPQEVRLRAASVPANLTAGRPTIAQNRLTASGTISPRARGVVRLQLLFEPAGQTTRTLQFSARIANGRYRISQQLPADVAAQIAGRRGVVHSYTLFTGYRQARMRGEMASFEVLGQR